MIGFYKGIIALGKGIKPLLLLLIRLFCGYAFFQAGSGKWMHISSVAEFFGGLGIPFSLANAYFIASLELVGGIFLMIGLASRLVALLLACNMIVAYLTAHFDVVASLVNGLNPGPFIEASPFLFLFSTLIIFSIGPGAISIDALLKRFIFKNSESVHIGKS